MLPPCRTAPCVDEVRSINMSSLTKQWLMLSSLLPSGVPRGLIIVIFVIFATRYFGCTGWFKPTSNLLSSQSSRRFMEIDPVIWHICSINPCRPVNAFLFIFFSQNILVFVHLGDLSLKGPYIFGAKKQNR